MFRDSNPRPFAGSHKDVVRRALDKVYKLCKSLWCPRRYEKGRRGARLLCALCEKMAALRTGFLCLTGTARRKHSARSLCEACSLHPRFLRHGVWRARPPAAPSRRTVASPTAHQDGPCSKHANLWEKISSAPEEPGVYLFVDSNGDILYVGKAISLRDRVRSYVSRAACTPSGVVPASTLNIRLASMVQLARNLDFIVTLSEAAALALEASLVREHKPPFNVLLKDDRRHPYVLITMCEEYPRVLLVRNPRSSTLARKISRRSPGRRNRLYGPYVNESRIRGVLDVIRKCFPLRQRAKPLHPNRPCLNYEVGRCPGPCQRLISPEEYGRSIAQVDKVLSGRLDDVLLELNQEISSAVATYDFERAAVYRDRRDVLKAGLVNCMDVQSVIDDATTASSIASVSTCHSQDIVASAADFAGDVCGVAKVTLFQRRGGFIVNRLVFTVQSARMQDELCASFDSVSNAPAAVGDLCQTAMFAALGDHYSRVEHTSEIPDEVVLLTSVATKHDAAMLSAALSARRGKTVRVIQHGSRREELENIVVRNAELEIEYERQKRESVRRSLCDLSVMLSTYFQHVSSSVEFERIECYDISHTHGSYAIGSMAVLINGEVDTRSNRYYSLGKDASSLGHPDDFKSIRETLLLRFSDHNLQHIKPDLIVIDGGKGQLTAALDALEQAAKSEIPVVALAKKEELLFVPNVEHAINSGTGLTDGIRLLCHARDQAHKKAVAAHRRARGKASLQSALEGINGLGKHRRESLLERFPGGGSQIATLSVDDLSQVPSIGMGLARRIHDYFADLRQGRSSPDEH